MTRKRSCVVSILAIALVIVVGMSAVHLSMKLVSGLIDAWLTDPSKSLQPLRRHFDVSVHKWSQRPEDAKLANLTGVWCKSRQSFVGERLIGPQAGDTNRILATASRTSGIKVEDLVVYFVKFVDLDLLPTSFSGEVSFTEHPSGGIGEILYGREVCYVTFLDGKMAKVERGRITW